VRNALFAFFSGGSAAAIAGLIVVLASVAREAVSIHKTE
jgi:hypothetical protein